jgi:hypothetical protein
MIACSAASALHMAGWVYLRGSGIRVCCYTVHCKGAWVVYGTLRHFLGRSVGVLLVLLFPQFAWLVVGGEFPGSPWVVSIRGSFN